MHDCIYTPYCTYKQCDLACPNRAEVNCWFKRCRLDMSNNCLHTNIRNIEKAEDLLSNKYGETVWFPTDNPSDASDTICYVAICKYGKGTALGNGIYNLDFAKFIDMIKESWNTHFETDNLVQMRVWSLSANYLVISNLDYVRFQDFESQTLLRLLNDRRDYTKTTVVVTSKEPLVGSGNFFPRLTSLLKGVKSN